MENRCIYCGQLFRTYSANKVYCSDICRANGIELRRQLRQEEKKRKKELKPSNDLALVAKLATEQGLTYGQYMARLYSENK